MADPERYREGEEVERWRERDPIAAFSGRLRGWGLIAGEDEASLEASVRDEVEAAVAEAEAGPLEPVEDLMRDVYAPAGGEAP
jgi:pyruvate dehydrogenase E1 component alpha subunit